MKIPNLRYCTPCGLTFHDANPIGAQPINCPTCGKPGPLLVPGPYFRHNLPKPPAAPWSLHFVAAWFDLWIGFYFDRRRRRLYFLPVPCLGVWIQLPSADRAARIIAREMRKAYREGKASRAFTGDLSDPFPPAPPIARRHTPGLIELRERETNRVCDNLRRSRPAPLPPKPRAYKPRDRWPGLK